MNQNQQFKDAMDRLSYAKESLDPARYAYVHDSHDFPLMFLGFEITIS